MKIGWTFILIGFCTLSAFHSESAGLVQAVPASNSISAQPLTADQAKAALDRKQEPKPGPGTWRYVTISMDPWSTTFETNYLYVTTNDQRFERIEQTVHSTNKTSFV